MKTKNIYRGIFLGSLLLFEMAHAYSHIKHIKGHVQTNMIHALTYLINISLLFMLIHISSIRPPLLFMGLLGCLVVFDIYALYHLSLEYYIISQAAILLAILLFYYPHLSSKVQQLIPYMLLCIIIIIGLFFNERYSCDAMLKHNSNIPYHVFIEIPGLVFFVLLCISFYK